MILAFTKKFENTGKNTFFPEKVLAGLEIEPDEVKYIEEVLEREDLHYYVYTNCTSKKQTIRRDEEMRWKVGMDVHFVIDDHINYYYQFAPVRKVTAIKTFEVIYAKDPKQRLIENPIVKVAGRILNPYKLNHLAVNDGFANTQQFLQWFNEDFKGRIIYWDSKKAAV